MGWIIELIKGLFEIIFSVSMEHPYEKKEEYVDVTDTTVDDPDSIFTSDDW